MVGCFIFMGSSRDKFLAAAGLYYNTRYDTVCLIKDGCVEKKKILFVNPPSRETVYLKTFVKVGAPSYPNITLGVLAGQLAARHRVRIMDLELCPDPWADLKSAIREFQPDFVATTSKTPYFHQAMRILRSAKEADSRVTTLIGGVHATTFPEETVEDGTVDIVVCGEGEETIREIVDGRDLASIEGIHYKDEQGRSRKNPERKLVSDLDSLAFPVWEGYDLSRYANSRLSSRKNPCGLLETSRGCPYQCNYCNKNIFGSRCRYKSTERVMEEIRFYLESGFRELHVVDDSFTQDLDRAKEICAAILRRGFKFPWALFNGVRVDRVDLEFFQLAKRAGCWQVAFGVESGDQGILDRVGKKTTVPKIRKAMEDAKRAGLDTFGFFILGLPGETEDTLKETIRFSKSLPFDMVKYDILVPYPGTPCYKELLAENRIRTTDWSKYLCHGLDEPVFDHPNLRWETLSFYYKKAFRDFYLDPRFIWRRFFRSLRMGDLWFDFKYFINTRW